MYSFYGAPFQYIVVLLNIHHVCIIIASLSANLAFMILSSFKSAQRDDGRPIFFYLLQLLLRHHFTYDHSDGGIF